MRSTALKLFGSIALLGATSFSAHANLLTNGSFEAPNIGDSSFQTYGPIFNNAFDISGWHINYETVDLVSSNYWSTADGKNNSIDLDGNKPAAITQAFTGVQDQTYHVTFALSGNPEGRFSDPDGLVYNPIKKLTVQIHDSNSPDSIFNFEFDTSVITTGNPGIHPYNMNYVLESFYFTAMTSDLAITFLSGDDSGPFGPVIDDVQIEPVPLPAAAWLLGSAVLGLAGFGRRKSLPI